MDADDPRVLSKLLPNVCSTVLLLLVFPRSISYFKVSRESTIFSSFTLLFRFSSIFLFISATFLIFLYFYFYFDSATFLLPMLNLSRLVDLPKLEAKNLLKIT